MTTAPETEDQSFSEVEARLKEDVNGEFKQALHEELCERIAAVDRQIKAGASPQEYRRLETIKTGLEAADFVRERIWLHYHQAP